MTGAGRVAAAWEELEQLKSDLIAHVTLLPEEGMSGAQLARDPRVAAGMSRVHELLWALGSGWAAGLSRVDELLQAFDLDDEASPGCAADTGRQGVDAPSAVCDGAPSEQYAASGPRGILKPPGAGRRGALRRDGAPRRG